MSDAHIEAWLAGTMAVDEHEALAAWLSEDEAHRLQLLQAAAEQEALRLLYRPSTWHCPAAEVHQSEEGKRPSVVVLRWSLLCGMVAAILVTVSVVLYWWSETTRDRDGVEQQPVARNPDDLGPSIVASQRKPVVMRGLVRLADGQHAGPPDQPQVVETDAGEALIQWGADLQLVLGSNARVLLARTPPPGHDGELILERGTVELQPLAPPEPTVATPSFIIRTGAGAIQARGARLKVAMVHMPLGPMVSVAVSRGEVTIQASRHTEIQVVPAGTSVLLPVLK